MSFAPGDVVAVPFPCTDSLAEKRRPAVVVSSPQLERDHGLLWLAVVTSSAKRWRGDVPVTDLEAAGLPVRCVVRPAESRHARSSRPRAVLREGIAREPSSTTARFSR